MLTTYVTEVVDGDSFKTSFGEMRLEGVDAPEKNYSGWVEAKKRLEELILHKQIGYIGQARDTYGRLIVQIRINGRNVNDEMADFISHL